MKNQTNVHFFWRLKVGVDFLDDPDLPPDFPPLSPFLESFLSVSFHLPRRRRRDSLSGARADLFYSTVAWTLLPGLMVPFLGVGGAGLDGFDSDLLLSLWLFNLLPRVARLSSPSSLISSPFSSTFFSAASSSEISPRATALRLTLASYSYFRLSLRSLLFFRPSICFLISAGVRWMWAWCTTLPRQMPSSILIRFKLRRGPNSCNLSATFESFFRFWKSSGRVILEPGKSSISDSLE